MRIGTMSILFREQPGTDSHKNYVESLERINSAGFCVADINLCQICGHKTNLHTDDWHAEAEKIAATINKLGISVPQCHLPFKSRKIKWREPGEYEYYIKMFYRAIDVAAYLGIPGGVIHPDYYRKSNMSEEEKLHANHSEYDRLIEYALNKNLNIAYENTMVKTDNPNDTYYARAEELVELVDSYNDDLPLQ